METVLRNYIGGEWIQSSGSDSLEITNPGTGEILGQVPLSSATDVEQAVSAAKDSFKTWRQVPPVVRARHLFRLRDLLETHFEEIAETVTRENGKILAESRGSVRRGIENVEHACGIPTLMMGRILEDIAAGIDCEYVRQPLGVFAAVTPFNFPAMVPFWFWPYAIATGNTFILKASEQVPLTQVRVFELAHEAGIPPGVLNMVHGDRVVVDALLEHPDIVGISFVGSSPVAKHIYQEAARHGKRVQALGGAKNHIVVMPDADMDLAIPNVAESAFGCAGQRCLAGSVVVLPGKAYEPVRDLLLQEAQSNTLGYGLDPNATMGPVVSQRHKERVISFVDAGEKDGARLLLDGRGATVKEYPHGQFVGPTVFDNVDPSMAVGKEEIFGPVASITRVGDLDEAIETVQRSGFANATSIFTTSGKAAREFRYRVGVSMIGVNIGVAAPMAFFPFGGTKGSFFGDLKANGSDAIEFYTDKKVVISRW